ncbi:nucleotidyl transferase AbiEii/AbiGii toxin family protein [Sulfurimonas sp.]|uniref:nucleotidyl transferase AbiEii/AbiGii toxin family protein n=1 Tax=Sulfurimonas sp. TaxID=2022749 RepID=UPI002B4A6AD5|nr:nucleotidyl transferase AbiEii/AbiGii toxin family protein [Sulfurimonas sp.]
MQDLKNLNYLLPKTQDLLEKLYKDCPFLNKYVLVGGSALALHICHRKSEDLDFFTYEDDFNKQEIFRYLENFKNSEILNQTNEQIDLLLNGVKVTFFNAKWKFLKPEKIEILNLASLKSISAMKVNVIFLRAKYRDYYDLYFLVKQIGIENIFKDSLQILDGLTFKLFMVSLLYIDDIEDDNIDYLNPIKTISKEEIRDFFQIEINKLKI